MSEASAVSHSALMGRARFWALRVLPAVGAFGFAYWGLLGYEPYAGAGFEALPSEAESFFFQPSGNPPVLLALITLLFFYDRRYRIREAYGHAPLLGVAVPLLLAAAGLHLWATFLAADPFLIVSLIFLVLGVGALLGGAAGLRAVRLPAIFLLLLLPIPAEILNYVIYELQLFAASFVVSMLDLGGVAAVQSGDQIFTKAGIFHVIETCSGMRTIQTLTMAAFVYAEVFHRSQRRAVLLVIAGPIIGLAANQIRVISIVLNPYSEFSAVHTMQGIIMVVIGVLLLAGFDAALGRVLPESWIVRKKKARPDKGPRVDPIPLFVLVLALLAVLGAARFLVQPWALDEARPQPLSALPAAIADWRVSEGLPLDREFLGSVAFSEWVNRRYARGDDPPVELFVGSDRRLRMRTSLLSKKTALPGAGWALLDQGRVELGSSGAWVDELETRSVREHRLVYHWRSGVEGVPREALRSSLGLDQSPLRRPGRALVFRTSTPIASTATGVAEARARLQEFSLQILAIYDE